MAEYTMRLLVRFQADNESAVQDDVLLEAIQTFPGVTEVTSKGLVKRKVPAGRPADERATAEAWLRSWLARRKPTPVAVVYAAAEQAGISRRTLRRAADHIKVVRDPTYGGPKTRWSLPKEKPDA